MAAVESDFPRGVSGDKKSSNPQNNAPNMVCVLNILFNYAFCSLNPQVDETTVIYCIKYTAPHYLHKACHIFFQCCAPRQEYTSINVSLMHMHIQLHVMNTRIQMRRKL